MQNEKGGSAMQILRILSILIAGLFFLCYSYQILYIPAALRKQKQENTPIKLHKYAVLICARNESAVIAELIESLKRQTYPASLTEIFVLADNCTDRTAEIAGSHGATVYERYNQTQIGKGYALQELLEHIRRDRPMGFDGYFVFDADNVLSPDYIERMNETFSEGFDAVTSYRNSKNYGDNWISAGYALWFLRESQYLNRARMKLSTSCAVSGTGFLFSRKLMEQMGGWPFHLLTEDIEFTVQHVLRGVRIGYCERAELFDEQPTDFRQSWRQRTRWTKGYLQVFSRYGKDLMRQMIRGDFAAFDMAMNIMPAFFLSAAGLLVELTAMVLCLLSGGGLGAVFVSLLRIFGSMCGLLFVLGALTTVTEWNRIRATKWEKIRAVFTFPIFMTTYLPIAICAVFAKAEWKPIEHKVSAKRLDLPAA